MRVSIIKDVKPELTYISLYRGDVGMLDEVHRLI